MAFNPLADIYAEDVTDVMVGAFVLATDPALDENTGVLPGKFWIQIDGSGVFQSLKYRSSDNQWITIPTDGANSNGTIYSDITVPAEIPERTALTGTEDQDEIFGLLKALLMRGGATEI